MDMQFPNRSLALCQLELGKTVPNWLPLRASVPQWSKVDPILFVILINDLKLASHVSHTVNDITISENN